MFAEPLSVTLGLLNVVLYLMVGHYSFEYMAIIATKEDAFFFRDLRNGVPAARVVWFVYLLAWPLLHAVVLVGLWKRPSER